MAGRKTGTSESKLNDYREVLSKAQFSRDKKFLASKKSLLEYFKKLKLNANQFAYIINIATQSIPIAKGFETCLGYRDEEITLDNLHGIIHPDDRVRMKDIIVAAYEFGLSIKLEQPFILQFSVDYRVIKKDGTIIRVNRHSTCSEIDKDGKMFSTISICTDISHLKSSNRITAKMFGHPEAYRFNNIYCKEIKRLKITSREKDILSLIAVGRTTKEIASILGISSMTIETMRKRMIKKYAVLNTTQLVTLAKEQHII